MDGIQVHFSNDTGNGHPSYFSSSICFVFKEQIFLKKNFWTGVGGEDWWEISVVMNEGNGRYIALFKTRYVEIENM